MPGAAPLLAEWDDVLGVLKARAVPIAHHVALRGGSYAPHRDPFDRLLAAEAELSGVGLITADRVFTHFPVEVIW
jgi:PIN domain nuclease of toxin-antitoxin system